MAKLESFVFYILVIAIPFQTRIILKIWGDSFNEWSSAFLYGTDLLILSLLLFWLRRFFSEGRARRSLWQFGGEESDAKKRPPGPSRADKFLLIFLGIAVLSIVQASNIFLGFYSWLKLLEFVWLYCYLRTSLGRIISLKWFFFAVIASGVFQSLVAIGQSLFQQSLGLKWLGESVLRTNLSGVAVVPWMGEKFLRAYGTTPHPNILASWLFLAIFSFYFWYFYYHTRKASIFWSVFLVYPILLWGLFSTFSRVAIGLWGVGMAVNLLIMWLKRKKYNLGWDFKRKWRLLFVVTGGAMLIFGFFYWSQLQSRIFISAQDQAVSQRIFYIKMAGEMILDKPWLGVGLGQFVGAMMALLKDYPSYFYQPVHNIYLLIVNEVGFLGLTAFLGWLAFLFYEYIKSIRFKELYQISFFIVFSSILVMGFFDHFFWTLQQGQLIFWLTFGLVVSGKIQKVI